MNRIETRIEEPVECPHCHKKGTFQLEHNLCYFSDKQLIKIQETPNMIPEGETPQNVTLYCYDDNIDKVKPGDRVEVFTNEFTAYCSFRLLASSVLSPCVFVLQFEPFAPSLRLISMWFTSSSFNEVKSMTKRMLLIMNVIVYDTLFSCWFSSWRLNGSVRNTSLKWKRWALIPIYTPNLFNPLLLLFGICSWYLLIL